MISLRRHLLARGGKFKLTILPVNGHVCSTTAFFPPAARDTNINKEKR